MLGDVIYSYTYVYIAFYLKCKGILVMNSDELTEVSPFTDSQRDMEPPPPLLVGVGAEDGEMTARRLYIS